MIEERARHPTGQVQVTCEKTSPMQLAATRIPAVYTLRNTWPQSAHASWVQHVATLAVYLDAGAACQDFDYARDAAHGGWRGTAGRVPVGDPEGWEIVGREEAGFGREGMKHGVREGELHYVHEGQAPCTCDARGHNAPVSVPASTYADGEMAPAYADGERYVDADDRESEAGDMYEGKRYAAPLPLLQGVLGRRDSYPHSEAPSHAAAPPALVSSVATPHPSSAPAVRNVSMSIRTHPQDTPAQMDALHHPQPLPCRGGVAAFVR
jgi:hypothetical protein